MNKAMCVAPWLHVHVEPTGDVQLCCASNLKHDHNESMGNLNTSTPEEIWNNERYREVRRHMLQNRLLGKYCSACYQREDGSINWTERQRLNKEFPIGFDFAKQTDIDGSFNKIDIRYLDIRFNNLCNLKCRTCGPHWSTQWATEMGLDDTVQYNRSWQKLIPYLDNLEKVYFAGGEPLMQREHYDFLEHLLEKNPNVQLLYTSNFTRLKLGNRHVMDYWSQFRLVEAVASIDHFGKHAAYVRTGSDYENIKQNIQEVKSYGINTVRPSVTSVLSLYNVTRIGDFVKQLWQDDIISDMRQIVFNMLVNPAKQNALIMPERARDLALENIQQGIDFVQEKGDDPEKLISMQKWIEHHWQHDAELFKQFVEYNLHLDKIRNTRFEDFYPEFV